MNPRISLLLPTRERPALAKRLFDSIVRTAVYLDEVEVIVYVDEDDIASHALHSDELNYTLIIGPNTTMGRYNTACLERARGDIIVLVNDDMVMRTPGWDRRLLEIDASFPDGIYLGYPNDLFKGGKLCTFPILSRRCCELLAEPYPAQYAGAFIDVHLFDIFKRLQAAGHHRIRYLDDVVFEHLHYRTGKAACDATYKRRGRFADDNMFIQMASARETAAKWLLQTLNGQPMSRPVEKLGPTTMPEGLLRVVNYFTRRTLLDRNLPFKWRLYLWYWFTGRYLAARGYLRPFVGSAK